MKTEKDKTFAQIAVGRLARVNDGVDVDWNKVSEYLLKELDIDYSQMEQGNKMLLTKNFIHLMCLIIKDIKTINSRIKKYQKQYEQYKNDKSNVAEYYRRKLKYFCSINKKAINDILSFIQNGLKKYSLENQFDTMARGQDGLTDMYMGRRYNAAMFPEYYDIEFDFETIVKVNHLPDVPWIQMMEVEKEYLLLHKNDPIIYRTRLRSIVDDEDIMSNVVYGVGQNYHIHKRKEIFQDLEKLFKEKHYQSFIALGLLELEGLFYDLCQIKYGTKENLGTLVEKVEKSFSGGNELSFMRYYPYFAFDVPIMRNEIAHKGMIETEDLESMAYNLVLDLNSVAKMVERESYAKFIVFLMTNEALKKCEADSVDVKPNKHKALVTELLMSDVIANEEFWKILKNPDAYREEINFYKHLNFGEEDVELSQIVDRFSGMVLEKEFWDELLDIIKDNQNEEGVAKTKIEQFADKIYKDYIAILTGEAKTSCIEVAKILKNSKDV